MRCIPDTVDVAVSPNGMEHNTPGASSTTSQWTVPEEQRFKPAVNVRIDCNAVSPRLRAPSLSVRTCLCLPVPVPAPVPVARAIPR